MKIISIVTERSNEIHRIEETDGSVSVTFYGFADCEIDGVKTEVDFYRGEYDKRDDTLTLYWRKIKREA